MVKIYLEGKNEYFDIRYSSILKAYFIGWIGWTFLMGIGIAILFFLISIS